MGSLCTTVVTPASNEDSQSSDCPWAVTSAADHHENNNPLAPDNGTIPHVERASSSSSSFSGGSNDHRKLVPHMKSPSADDPCQKAGIPPAMGSLPSLRDSFSSECGAENRALLQIGRLAGHASEFTVDSGRISKSMERRDTDQPAKFPRAFETYADHSTSDGLDSGKVSSADRAALVAQFSAEQAVESTVQGAEAWGSADQRTIMMATFYGISAAELSASQGREGPDLHVLDLSCSSTVGGD